MKTRTIVGLGLVTAVAFLTGRAMGRASLPVTTPAARCVVYVPREWGEYQSADRYGISFKDESGTLRFVSQLPCSGLDAPLHIALEIRRK
jgi:hypothetical protein